MFNYNNIKKNIISRLKTFSQIKEQYNIENEIFRSGEREYFSKIAKKYGLEGCPKSRTTCRLSQNSYENTKKDEDILEPIWYSCDASASKDYCRSKTDCVTYSYTPLDVSLYKKTRLLFLDLTDSTSYEEIKDDNGKKIKAYKLFKKLMVQIYNNIYIKYKNQIVQDKENIEYLCVDNPCENEYTIQEINSAYGFYDGFRNSEKNIDRFFTIELFQIIKDLNIEKDNNCIVLGYYHSDLITGTIEHEYFPGEFTIKYGYSINKNCIKFNGEINNESKEKSKGGKKINKIKNNTKKNKIKN